MKRLYQVAPVAILLVVMCSDHTLAQGNFSFWQSDDFVEDRVVIKRKAINLNGPIRYLLYSRSNNTWMTIPSNGSVPLDLWNYGGHIKILVHGFNGKLERDPMRVMQSMMIVGREYGRKNESLNIIAMDWTPLASRPVLQYPEAAKNTGLAGIALATYLLRLRANSAFRGWRKVHIIGFSLGAHTAGVAGQEIFKLTKGRKIGRITGLDPAGPEFDGLNQSAPSDPAYVLDKSDANYVDIIHCNMGGLPPLINVYVAAIVGKFGSGVQAGHADFYPNGGERQSYQCDEFRDRTGCSHNMCALFYALSITTELPACPCSSWTFYIAGLCGCSPGDEDKMEYMGDMSNRRGTARGKYFLYVENKVSVNYFLKIK